MGNKVFKVPPPTEFTQKQIAILMKDTRYTEKDIREWHTEFLRSCPNGQLNNEKLIEMCKIFYQQGKADNISKAVGSKAKIALKLGDEFPDFYVKTTIGDIQLHDWIADSWCILFSHPADFTPVCTTELSRAAKLTPEFARRDVKCIALSCDSIENHHDWIKDLQAYGNANDDCNDTCQSAEFPFPIIEDTNRKLAKQLGMIDPEQFDSQGLPLTARAVFIIGPNKTLKASILYPATTGRSFDEILRLIDGLQLSARLPVATPVNWKVGQKVMVPSNIKDEDIKRQLPQGVDIQGGLPSGKNYIRMTQV